MASIKKLLAERSPNRISTRRRAALRKVEIMYPQSIAYLSILGGSAIVSFHVVLHVPAWDCHPGALGLLSSYQGLLGRAA